MGGARNMKVSAELEYGLLAVLEVAQASAEGKLITSEEIAQMQRIPSKFLESILTKLRKAGVVTSKRGRHGGYQLRVDPKTFTAADLVRSIDGPLVGVRDKAPETTRYRGAGKNLTKVWVASRASLRKVLENVTLSEILADDFEPSVRSLLDEKSSWRRRAANTRN